ncbi:MAG: hypothetical protein M1814_005024 [Vezdaea aestivalis]|nr:MAG: hypothetical protein M1814_005024 [Vezdaea aestivalis]
MDSHQGARSEKSAQDPKYESDSDEITPTISNQYEEINAGDRNEIVRLASKLSRTFSPSNPAHNPDPAHDVESLGKIDTLAGLSAGDPVLDPTKPEFDIYKWVRFYLSSLEAEEVPQKRAGLVFRNLNVSGSDSALNLQQNVGSIFMAPFRLGEHFSFRSKPLKPILRDFNGFLRSGEMLIVLGRPGSGCSTFLKTVSGELNGLSIDKSSVIHYNGIPQSTMKKEFRGEVVYNQEVDRHFPYLTVGETLEFAAAVRTPQNRKQGTSRQEYIKDVTQVVMATMGLRHTYNTRVGNDFIRGVSGGERKRVSIAEMSLAGAPNASWDNSTRGLDSASALEFVKALRIAANLSGASYNVAIYQASQAIYDIFDKAVVLYEGRQIYFGPAVTARAYFENMGWHCPPRQTTGDFLTAVTNPGERKARPGFEDKVPRTPDDFVEYWRASPEAKQLQSEMNAYEDKHPVGGNALGDLTRSKNAAQASNVRPKSPYTVSIPMQIRLNIKRAYQRVWNDRASTITAINGQVILALIVGSIFYNTPPTTDSFFSRASVLFMAILFNALMAVNEINNLYDQRPIVEKQASYAFYHPFTEAIAGVIADIPVKFLIAVAFNLILYFLAGLRRQPAQFFIYFLFNYIAGMTMSAIFKTTAAATKSISQALAISGVLILATVIYTGFAIPVPLMHPWFSWIRFINPVAYAFEGILVNELHGREFICSQQIPGTGAIGENHICSVAGAVQGSLTVSGDAFVEASYQYAYSHLWRNFGIMCAFLIFFLVAFMVIVEINSSTSSVAEVLVFRRGHVPKEILDGDKAAQDEENLTMATRTNTRASNVSKQNTRKSNAIPAQTDVFTWRNIVYDISIKGEPRRLLDNVSGWVKPGTLTALMGVSGAGKTTLLDALAQRTTIGVITGDMFVNGAPLDSSFQRKTGYVQQQDLHLDTTTVREALRFSAMLRQPKSVSKEEKFEFVEDVIQMLGMESYAEAVVGVPGEGLNVEQRKLLTIGVELAAKPALLLFLDEPTSGLDSQSSWAIVAFLRKLADHGQAVLSTIHQPSAILFQEFDRLLFLAKGGKTVYFGNIGENSEELLDYFSANGARTCEPEENPAEYMLEVVGAGASGKSAQDWPTVWNNSREAAEAQTELERIHKEMAGQPDSAGEGGHTEFAMPFWTQLQWVTVRVFQQYWRNPTYIYSKYLLGIVSALFIAFTFFQPDPSQQGAQNVLFSVFMIMTILSTHVGQIMPRFVEQRRLFEVREKPSKAYSWAAFFIANVTVEIPYQIGLAIGVFAAWYYPIFGIQSSERQGLQLLYMVVFFIFGSTFAQLLIAALPDAETAGNISTLMFTLILAFNGVLQPPQALPGFWIFMYRASPLVYLIQGMVATGLHDRQIVCSDTELRRFTPPPGQNCGEYLKPFLETAPGRLFDSQNTTLCEYCPLSNADQLLAPSNIFWDTRWRNFGLIWVYIVFNVAMACLLYYTFRVRKFNLAAAPGKMAASTRKIGQALKRVFRRHPEDSKEGREEENNRIF